jgi:hypothetical protein
MRRSHRIFVVAALAAVLATVPATGQAAIRFARPGGANTGNCTGTLFNPKCRIERAVSVAVAGDTVVLDAGTYTLSSTLVIGDRITLVPAGAGIRPLIKLTAAQADTVRVAAGGAGTTIRGVEVDQTNTDSNGPASAVRTFGSTTLTDIRFVAAGNANALRSDADTTLSGSTATIHNTGTALDGVSVSTGHKLTLRTDFIDYGTGTGPETQRGALGGTGTLDARAIEIHTFEGCANLNSPSITLRDITIVQDPPAPGTGGRICFLVFGHASITDLHVAADDQAPAALLLSQLAGQGGITATDITVDGGRTALLVGGQPGTEVVVRRAILHGDNAVSVPASPFGTAGATLLLTDSVLRASAAGGVAVRAGSGTTINLRHSDAFAPDTTALRVEGCNDVVVPCGGVGKLDAQNVIARGSLDLSADCHDPCGQPIARMSLNHSSFNPALAKRFGDVAFTALTLGAGNQDRRTQPPVLPDGLHEAASSPTVDAGAPYGKIGANDIDGDPRTLGAATDIGADEFVP